MTQENYNELERIVGYTSAGGNRVSEIAAMHRKYINPNDSICTTCPDAIRIAHQKIKEWFNSNKGNISIQETKKKMDAPVVNEDNNTQPTKEEVIETLTPKEDEYTPEEQKVLKSVNTKKVKNKKKLKTKKDGKKSNQKKSD